MNKASDVLRNIPMSIENLIATGQPVTEERMEQLQKVKQYQNRERIPESYLPFFDLYVELCGKDQNGNWNQEPTKRVFSDWMLTFDEWKQERLTPDNIRAAFIKANSDNGFPVGRPGALTNTAVALKTKTGTIATAQINTEAIERTKQMLAEKWGEKVEPVPRETRDASRARLKARWAEIDTQREAERRTR